MGQVFYSVALCTLPNLRIKELTVLVLILSTASIDIYCGRNQKPVPPILYNRKVLLLYKSCEHTDQLLTVSTWLHVSWSPFAPPRRFVRIGYYK